jgi:hypothetical protein
VAEELTATRHAWFCYARKRRERDGAARADPPVDVYARKRRERDGAARADPPVGVTERARETSTGGPPVSGPGQ